MDPRLIQQLKELDNKASRVVELWLDIVFERYIIELVVNMVKSYSDRKRIYTGPRCRFLLYLQLWMKMLIYEKRYLENELL